jgi:hypothetical protein
MNILAGLSDHLRSGSFEQPNDIQASAGDLIEFYRGLSLKLNIT